MMRNLLVCVELGTHLSRPYMGTQSPSASFLGSGVVWMRAVHDRVREPMAASALERCSGVRSAWGRMAVQTLARHTSERERDAHPAASWVIVGAVLIGAAPGVTALVAGLMLQVVVFGWLAAGAASIERGATGWVRRAEIEPAMGGVEEPGVWSWPVAGRITTAYGGCTVAMCPHWGIDIAAPPGTPVCWRSPMAWSPRSAGTRTVMGTTSSWPTAAAGGRSMRICSGQPRPVVT